MSVTLTPAEFTATVEKFAKINERAAKRGFTGRLVVEGERFTKTTVNPITFIETTQVLVNTTVGGEAPSYGGWTFLARVDALGDTFTLTTAPGVEQVDRSLVRPGVCDHCQATRNRKKTMLVRNDETGEVVNVGTSCIKDFLGWDANVVFFGDDDAQREVEGFAGTGEWTFTVESVIRVAYAATKAFGWVPSSAPGQTTRSWVELGLGLVKPAEREVHDLERLREFAAEAGDKAAEILAFLASDAFAGASTYVDNLKALAGQQEATLRHLGLLASAPSAYIRHLEGEAKRAAKPVSEYLFEVGQKKVVVEGTISAIRYISGDYSTTTLYTITTPEGNLVKWFSSNGALGEQEGVEVKITGTVKEHNEYQGVKSTILTRCKSLNAGPHDNHTKVGTQGGYRCQDCDVEVLG